MPDATETANRAYNGRSLSMRRNQERGTITMELPVEDGELVDMALTKVMEKHSPNTPELAPESFRAQQADALVAIARQSLSERRYRFRCPPLTSPTGRGMAAGHRSHRWRSNFVDAHHVMHWANGGETSVDNVILLCDRLHRLVHEGGYTICKDHKGQWYFRRPDGRVVPDCGYQLDDMLDDDVGDAHLETLARTVAVDCSANGSTGVELLE